MRATSFQDHPASAADRGCCACSIYQNSVWRPSPIFNLGILLAISQTIQDSAIYYRTLIGTRMGSIEWYRFQ